jgi:hypothetical protein
MVIGVMTMAAPSWADDRPGHAIGPFLTLEGITWRSCSECEHRWTRSPC